jgi:hypothetical protein
MEMFTSVDGYVVSGMGKGSSDIRMDLSMKASGCVTSDVVKGACVI